jgi:hypothetical protein
MHWMIERAVLDEVQEAILTAVTNDPGPHWIEGYAGTGKTIIGHLPLGRFGESIQKRRSAS